MGVFKVDIGVGHPDGGDLAPVTATVDTGASHSMMPDSLLAGLGMTPIERDEYILADGSIVEYGLGLARFAVSGREFPCPVIFGPEEEYLLGATTLETFNFMADPVGKRLVRTPRRVRPI